MTSDILTPALDTLLERGRRWLAENFDPEQMQPEDAYRGALDSVLDPDGPDLAIDAALEIIELHDAGNRDAKVAVGVWAHEHTDLPASDWLKWKSARDLVAGYLVNARFVGFWDVTTDLDTELMDVDEVPTDL